MVFSKKYKVKKTSQYSDSQLLVFRFSDFYLTPSSTIGLYMQIILGKGMGVDCGL